MLQKILYAKEYPIDIPEGIVANRELLVANTANEAISLIDQDPSIAGYVLGIVMLKDNVTPKYVFNVENEEYGVSKLLDRLPRHDLNRLAYERRRDLLCEHIHSLLDYTAGERVFEHLQQKGYFGKKPMLFFTSQYGGGCLASRVPRDKIELVGMPATYEELETLFKRTFDDK